uniref:cytosolic phospholipase A2 zeta n=1 Tax=Myxine glutinosa TaxID=7769 RepID=UPI00358DE536
MMSVDGRKPQCYVQLRLPSASSETFRTSAVRNCANPTWRQTFTFYIHTTLKNVMELILFDGDRAINNQISSLCVDLDGLKTGKREREKIVLDEKKRMLLEVEFFLEKSESHPHPVFTNGVLMARQCWKVQVCVLHLGGLPAEGIHSHAIVLGAPDSYERMASTTKCKGSEPVWDEYFTFHTDSGRDNLLFVTLHDTSHMSELASHFGRATAVGKGSCQLNTLPLNETVKITVLINEGLQVDLNLKVTNSLSDGEKEFLKRRAKIAALAFSKVLNHQKISKNCRVPVVAVLGSGGGVRAMTSFYGSLSGLERMGILDCIAYAFGVSGSNWALGTIYQDPYWSEHGLDSAIHELRARLTGSKLNLLTSDWLRHCRDALRDKEARGLRTCLTDLWGFVLEWMLYGQENPARLSEQHEAVRHGQNPYPIYAAVNVKRDVESCKFSEWVEFTPHEVGLPKYGAFIPARNFESEFFMGHLVRRHPEPPLHYLLGLWGSAFAKSLRDLFNDLLKKQNSPDGKQDTEKQEPIVDQDLAQVPLRSKEPTELTGVTIPDSSARGTAEEALSIEVSTPERFIKQVLHEALGTRLSVSHVPNFLSGHFLVQNFEQFPDFSPWKDNNRDHHANQLSPFMKKLHLVDAGLSINLAFPLAQRPERRANLILSFDYSWDKPFEALKQAAAYFAEHDVPFPPVDVEADSHGELRECYLFEDQGNASVPLVLHFPLVNQSFRNFTQPGVPRRTKIEQEDGDFKVFVRCSPYSTLDFRYTEREFDRLVQLARYNVLNNAALIHKALAKAWNHAQHKSWADNGV